MRHRKKQADEVVIVLHEIYGINGHMKYVCGMLRARGYDAICPNLIGRDQAFDYAMAEQAYRHFMQKIGFADAVEKVRQVVAAAKRRYSSVYLLGYSIGATIAWLCSAETESCDGMICYYGSRIRDYKEITPKCPQLLFFPTEEEAFDAGELAAFLAERKFNVHLLQGRHGFGDPYSVNHSEKAAGTAEKLAFAFLSDLKNENLKIAQNLKLNDNYY